MNHNQGQIMRSPYPSNQIATSQPNQSGSTSTNSADSVNNINTASLCKAGTETVQEIVAHTIKIFKELKAMQVPNGTPQGIQYCSERKGKLAEYLMMMKHLFRKLRIIYEKLNSDCGGMEYTPIETLIPFKDGVENKPDVKSASENYKQCVEEGNTLRESLYVRSCYLKEVINMLRKIIWEINTMLMMRNL